MTASYPVVNLTAVNLTTPIANLPYSILPTVRNFLENSVCLDLRSHASGKKYSPLRTAGTAQAKKHRVW